MNQLKLLFALSVALNVAFITLLLLQVASSPRHWNFGETTIDGMAGGADLIAMEDGSPGEGVADAVEEGAPATLQAYLRLWRALRATGLPEAEMQRILRGTAMADWQDDVMILLKREAERDRFWRVAYDIEEVELRRKIIELRRAREAALAELLGETGADLSAGLRIAPDWLGLSAEDRRALRMLEDDYELLMAGIHARSNNVMLPEDIEAFRLLRAERREDLGRILSAAGIEEYELRHSDTSRRLRRELEFFNASEEEFRDIFGVHHEIGLIFPDGSGSLEQRRTAEEAMNRALRDLLGDERFAEYALTSDPHFRLLASLTNRLNLPMENARRLHEFMALLEEQYVAIGEELASSPDQQLESIRLLDNGARGMVREILGEAGYQAYIQSEASWFRQIDLLDLLGEREPSP